MTSSPFQCRVDSVDSCYKSFVAYTSGASSGIPGPMRPFIILHVTRQSVLTAVSCSNDATIYILSSVALSSPKDIQDAEFSAADTQCVSGLASATVHDPPPWPRDDGQGAIKVKAHGSSYTVPPILSPTNSASRGTNVVTMHRQPVAMSPCSNACQEAT
jgi:hypothetical protein